MTHDEMMSLLANTLADAAGSSGCLPILDCFSPHPGEEVTVSGCQIQEWDYDGSNKALSQRGEGNSLLMGYYNDHPWQGWTGWCCRARNRQRHD